MNIIGSLPKILDQRTSDASVGAMKCLYACTILSRLSNSRSKEEVREIATRDVPAWMTFFYLAAVIEKSVGYCLDKITASAKTGISLLKGQKEGRSLLKMLNPLDGEYKVRSFEDIKSLKDVVDPQNYKDLMRNKCGVYAIGLLASIAVLGIIIPTINVVITRKKVMEKQNKMKEQAAAANLNKTA